MTSLFSTRRVLASAGVMLLASISACGGGGSSTDTATTNATTTTASATIQSETVQSNASSSAASASSSSSQSTAATIAAAPPASATAAVTPPLAGSTAKLLFSSGFDGNLNIVPPPECWATGCWQDLTGTDSTTGSVWNGDLWGGLIGKFLLLTDPVSITPATISEYLFNRIETVTDHNGGQSKALYQQVTKNANGTSPMGTSPQQNEFLFMPKSDPGDVYVSYWMKLQPDLVQKMNNLPEGPGINGGGTWRAIFAMKTGGQTSWGEPADNGDYRIEAYVMTYGGGQPYWQILGDSNAGGGAPSVNGWSVQNRDVPVPVGQWFKLEIFWHRSSGSDGRVFMAVDGQVIADRRGANMGAWNLPVNRIMAPILYSGSAMPIYQWVDNVEIWDGFPDAGGNPPYAAH